MVEVSNHSGNLPQHLQKTLVLLLVDGSLVILHTPPNSDCNISCVKTLQERKT